MIVFMDGDGVEVALTDNEEFIVCQILCEATELVDDTDLEAAAEIEEIVSAHISTLKD